MKQAVRTIAALFLFLTICLFSLSACFADETELAEAEIGEEVSVTGGKTAEEAAAQFIDRVMSGAEKISAGHKYTHPNVFKKKISISRPI